jgi:hypothetical protein
VGAAALSAGQAHSQPRGRALQVARLFVAVASRNDETRAAKDESVEMSANDLFEQMTADLVAAIEEGATG